MEIERFMRVEREIFVRERPAIEIVMEEDYAQLSDFIVIAKVRCTKRFGER